MQTQSLFKNHMSEDTEQKKNQTFGNCFILYFLKAVYKNRRVHYSNHY